MTDSTNNKTEQTNNNFFIPVVLTLVSAIVITATFYEKDASPLAPSQQATMAETVNHKITVAPPASTADDKTPVKASVSLTIKTPSTDEDDTSGTEPLNTASIVTGSGNSSANGGIERKTDTVSDRTLPHAKEASAVTSTDNTADSTVSHHTDETVQPSSHPSATVLNTNMANTNMEDTNPADINKTNINKSRIKKADKVQRNNNRPARKPLVVAQTSVPSPSTATHAVKPYSAHHNYGHPPFAYNSGPSHAHYPGQNNGLATPYAPALQPPHFYPAPAYTSDNHHRTPPYPPARFNQPYTPTHQGNRPTAVNQQQAMMAYQKKMQQRRNAMLRKMKQRELENDARIKAELNRQAQFLKTMNEIQQRTIQRNEEINRHTMDEMKEISKHFHQLEAEIKQAWKSLNETEEKSAASKTSKAENNTDSDNSNQAEPVR